MVIRVSAAEEIRRLVAVLGADDEVRREAAIARLAIIGTRAVDRLTAAYEATGDRRTRIAILRALESAGDHRIFLIARQALGDGGDLAIAGAGALRGLLTNAATAAAALDALLEVAMDRTAERRVRLACSEALREVPGGVRERVAAALRNDEPLALAGPDARPDALAAAAVWEDALDGRVPDAPSILRVVAQTRAPAAPLGALRKMVDVLREKEGAVRSAAAREEWRATRGALHQALALRNSRIGLYDIRETLAAAREPLPASFLAALHIVGDDTCLEALAAAYANARKQDARWRGQIAAAFRAIVARERLTRRHAVVRRIATRWPDTARDLFLQT